MKLKFEKEKPTTPGAYYVRGYHVGHRDDTALVEVRLDPERGLICNLHAENSELRSIHWCDLSDFSDDFEWAALVPAKSARMLPFQGLMVDTETMGLDPDAMVLTVGLVLFSTTEILRSYQFAVDLQEQQRMGRRVDIDTALWWMNEKQSAARQRLMDGRLCSVPVSTLQLLLSEWSRPLQAEEELPVWACGPDFDFTILGSLLKANHMQLPWKFWQQRDFRTIKHTFSRLEIEKPAAHDAEADALWQANYLIQLNKELGLVQP